MKGSRIELPRAAVGLSRWRRFRAAIDWPLVITILLICSAGLLNLYSATHGTKHHSKFDQQLRWMIVGSIVFVVTTMIDYRALVRLAWPIVIGAIGMLIVVRLLGEGAHSKGSYRWLNVGPLGIQPSEFAKLAIILGLAKLALDAEVSKLSTNELGLKVAALVIPVGLIAAQPDLGTATLLTLIILTVGFLTMVNVRPMVYVTLGGLLVVPLFWEMMHAYQKNRILAFIDPGNDPTGTGWHTRQSIFAVGSGRFWGKGFGEGTQNQFDFLPEHWTDFPYSVLAEEWGFAGSVALLLVFGFLLVWIMNVALTARDRTGAVICVGVGAMTFWHVVVNIAMVLGLAPVVGVTLPFISYGGSSLLVFFAAMGLVANVSLRKHGY
ncbi:MAG TPA: rod shape-determining protein RodA [Kofleriaceae bacterium]|nr:rod shape-determining protein RodA [Kofleriaceae bacterium]